MSLPFKRALCFTPQTLDNPIIPISIQPYDLIIAIDGGLQYCLDHNLKPHVLMGDMDSLNPVLMAKLASDCLIVRFPTEKNETDTQLAIEYCLEHRIKEIIVYNNLNGRFDHAMGLVQNLLEAFRSGANATLISSSQIIFILKKKNILNYPVKTLVSLIPLTEHITINKSMGFKYGMFNLKIPSWQTRALSNEIISSPAEIILSSGIALIVITPQT